MPDRILNHLCDYALKLSYRDLPQEVIGRTKHIVMDTVGCALGGAQSPPAKIARAAAAELTSAIPSTVLISGQKTSPDLAAFANGVMIRYLDFNDTYAGSPTCHPSDLLAPVLAVVDARNGSGKDVILGTVLGYEVLCGLIDSGAKERGHSWDQSTYGVIAAAVLAAKLFGHTKEQMANAISLAISSHISLEQIRRGQISHWKGCALANASRNAVFCAMLAAKGMTGPEEAFEGKAGFLSSTGIRLEIRPFADSADTYRIMKARLKAFPSGYFSQSAVEAILNLRSQIPDLDDIKEIRLQTFPAGYEVMGSGEANWQPETRESADHSLPFVMAVALMEGIVEIRHYDQMYYKRSDVRALMQKIKVRIGEEPVAAWPEVPLNIVDVEMKSGKVLSTKVAYHLGHFKRWMTDEERERKFRPLAEPLLPKRQIDDLLACLRRLDEVEQVSELISLTLAPNLTTQP
ncbi:MAG: MmgE/PrpD family protein [Deltaproteobacteria bacterium]|nr:MAG: MmgE/PrpD family protein [Deltaproteobacteria bacterium]